MTGKFHNADVSILLWKVLPLDETDGFCPKSWVDRTKKATGRKE